MGHEKNEGFFIGKTITASKIMLIKISAGHDSEQMAIGSDSIYKIIT